MADATNPDPAGEVDELTAPIVVEFRPSAPDEVGIVAGIRAQYIFPIQFFQLVHARSLKKIADIIAVFPPVKSR
jgi:hypothetical protein